MNQKEVVDLFAEIEKSCNVNAIRWNNIQLWPLIRLRLWWQLAYCDGSIEGEQANIETLQVDTKKINPYVYSSKKCISYFFWKIKDIYQSINLYKLYWVKIDGLFLTFHDEKYSDNELNCGNRHLDPLFQLAQSKNYRISYLHCSEEQQTRYDNNSSVIHIGLDNSRFPTFGFQRRAYKSNTFGLEELDNINSYLPDGCHIKWDELEAQIDLLNKYSRWYLKILKIISPSVAFYTCYYRPETMAFNAASKALGINTVDIQHGKQGRYHGLYSHWFALPENGYALLPKQYWCWGEEAEININRYRVENYPYHKTFIGGYLWLANVIEKYKKKDNVIPDIVMNGKNYQKIILVTLQPITDSPPDYLLQAMSQSPNEWLWLIRLHPRQTGEKEMIKDTLAGYQIDNYEMDYATQCSLYALLPRVDCHITAWSTVLIEALAFRIPSIIISEQGYELYEDRIESGVFEYAEDADELLNKIESVNKTETNENSNYYFMLNKNNISNTLSNLIN